jgi:hypothetical protein
MSTTTQKLEVLIVQHEQRVQRIRTYHDGCVRAFGQQMGFAFLAGLELNRVKDEIAHGQFMAWVEKHLPEIPHRTATRYMGFADALTPKLATVANLDTARLQLTNGDLPTEAKAEVLQAVHDVADGKTLTQLYRDLGVIRDKKDPNEGEKEKPKNLSPEEQLAAWKERDNSALQTIVDAMRTYMPQEDDDQDRPRYHSPELAKEARRIGVEFTKFLKRSLGKPKKGKASKASTVNRAKAALAASNHKGK